MNNFFRKILIKITGIGWCDTPRIQMEKKKYTTRKLEGRWCSTFDDHPEDKKED